MQTPQMNVLFPCRKSTDRNDLPRILCFHHAGGSALVFNNLRKSSNIWAIQLPGRGQRYREPKLTTIEQVVNQLWKDGLESWINEAKDYHIVAHSMGTWIVSEMWKRIVERGLRKPKHITLSGFPPPTITIDERTWRPNCELSENEFKKELLDWGVDPMLIQPDIFEEFRDILRADFSIFDQHVVDKIMSFDVPVKLVSATKDSKISREMVEKWKIFCENEVEFVTVEGPHLWIQTDPAKLAILL